jgi:hypothetical protein
VDVAEQSPASVSLLSASVSHCLQQILNNETQLRAGHTGQAHDRNLTLTGVGWGVLKLHTECTQRRRGGGAPQGHILSLLSSASWQAMGKGEEDRTVKMSCTICSGVTFSQLLTNNYM